MEDRPRPSPECSVRIALSGGGYRAMLFHVGALWKLNQVGELANLVHISSVSGGSIAAGVLAAGWTSLEFGESGPIDAVALNFRELVADPLMSLASRTIDRRVGVSGLIPFHPAARTLESLYRKHLFGETKLGDIPRHPQFTFNATNMHTGAVWTFERDVMGDETLGSLPAMEIPLARAVAGSSAFPPFFSPLRIQRAGKWGVYPHRYRSYRDYDDLAMRVHDPPSDEIDIYRRRVDLADGGVADNLGIIPVWKGDGDLYVSDGGGDSAPQLLLRRNWLSQLIRVVTLIHEQPSQLRARMTKSRLAGEAAKEAELLLDGAVWDMHYPRPTHRETAAWQDLSADACAELVEVPTRLKAMDADLQKRLVNWGYIACNRSLPYVNRLFGIGPWVEMPWAFKEESLPFPEVPVYVQHDDEAKPYG